MGGYSQGWFQTFLPPETAFLACQRGLDDLDALALPPTCGWFWISIAKLGGFLARKGDGHPGWLILWRGWQTLMIIVRGYELAHTS